MDHGAAGLPLDHVDDRNCSRPGEAASIVGLAAPGGIECRAIQDHGRLALPLQIRHHAAREALEVGILVVEAHGRAIGHGSGHPEERQEAVDQPARHHKKDDDGQELDGGCALGDEIAKLL